MDYWNISLDTSFCSAPLEQYVVKSFSNESTDRAVHIS